MTRVHDNQVFERFYDDGWGAVYSDILFRRCTFHNCGLSITKNPAQRNTVRNVQVIDCKYPRPVGIGAAIVEDSLVDGLRTSDLLQTWGMVFKHVTLRGKIDRVMLSTRLCPTVSTTESMQRAFEDANAAYYSKVDWALDISEVEFIECDIRGIPARLIRRDPETQVVITRKKALQGEWKKLDLEDTYWQVALDFMLEREDPDVVLVAPKRARDFKALLHGLQLLREAGVAEPD